MFRFLLDLRYGVRMLAKRPAFTALIVLSLALGIGANTAIFSAVNAVMLKMLPVNHPQQLQMLTWTVPTSDFPDAYLEDLEGSFLRVAGGRFGSYSISYPAYEQIAANNRSFDATFAFAANDQDVNVGISGRASSVKLVGASGNFFTGLGVTPAAGRAFQPSDDTASADPVVVISHRFWQSNLGGELSAIGRTIQIDGQPVTIVGVAPAEFFGVEPGSAPDLWVPLHWYAAEWAKLNGEPSSAKFLADKRAWWVGVIGRIKPGVTEAAATAEMSVLFQQTLQTTTDHPSAGMIAEYGGGGPAEEHSARKAVTPQLAIIPLAHGLDTLRREFSTSLWLLAGMVGLVLLITCSNVASLLITRATARQKEVAVRLSLGAPKSRIVLQVFTESLLLGVAGGLAGLFVARWTGILLLRLISSGRSPVSLSLAPDRTVLLFTAAITLLSTLFFGVAPAWFASRVRPLTTLKQGSIPAGSAKFVTGKFLVALQIALSFVLLVACGLFLRTLGRLQNVNLGFHSQNLTRFTVSPGLNGYSNQQLLAYYQNLETQLRTISGVESVSLSAHAPIGAGSSITVGKVPGYTAPGKNVDIYRHDVGPAYFETLQVPLLLGRGITTRDDKSGSLVVVINEAFTRKYFHGDNPIGHHIDLGSKPPQEFEVVGVARDVKYAQIRDDVPPTAYFPYMQRKEIPPFMTFEVRSNLSDAALFNFIEQTALRVDKNVPATKLKSETEAVSEVLYLERTFATLSSAFGGLALLLAGLGLYGTIAYTVAQRTNEIGIRMAVGADRQNIVTMIVRETLIVVSAGLLVGLPIAWFASRALRSQLFGLSPHDAVSMGIAVVTIVAVAALAGGLPARRASQVDPMEALRYE